MRVHFRYKNHKGHIEHRDVDVVSLEFNFQNHPEYGYQPGWCLSGWDFSRGRDGHDRRSFYLTNIILGDGNHAFRLLELPSGRRSVDPVAEFAMWLTTREHVVKAGASETVYAMIDALKEWEKHSGRSNGKLPLREIAKDDQSTQSRVSTPTIDEMVNRFLGWKLPDDFSPDGGITFTKVVNPGTAHEHQYAPVGTNLLTATQAKAMVEYMLAGMTVPALLEPLGPPDWSATETSKRAEVIRKEHAARGAGYDEGDPS